MKKQYCIKAFYYILIMIAINGCKKASYNVSGKIINVNTGDVVDNVKVNVSMNSIESDFKISKDAVTNAQGKYSITYSEITPGSFTSGVIISVNGLPASVYPTNKHIIARDIFMGKYTTKINYTSDSTYSTNDTLYIRFNYYLGASVQKISNITANTLPVLGTTFTISRAMQNRSPAYFEYSFNKYFSPSKSPVKTGSFNPIVSSATNEFTINL